MCWYTAVIECPDGSTYYQDYEHIQDLLYLCRTLGYGYLIVDLF